MGIAKRVCFVQHTLCVVFKVSQGKRRIMETQIFQHAKKLKKSSKKSSQRNKNLSRYYYKKR
jgi:hypothetical protein